METQLRQVSFKWWNPWPTEVLTPQYKRFSVWCLVAEKQRNKKQEGKEKLLICFLEAYSFFL